MKKEIHKKDFRIDQLTNRELILFAPDTACDPEHGSKFQPISWRVFRFLYTTSTKHPWHDQLVLLALIMSAQNYDQSTVYGLIQNIHRGLRRIFNTRELKGVLKTIADWNPDIYMPKYLAGAYGSESKQSRYFFWLRYKTATLGSQRWLSGLPRNTRALYQPLLLPVTNEGAVAHLTYHLWTEVSDEQKAKRKHDVDVLMPLYPQLRTLAHMRYNQFIRLRNNFKEAVQTVQAHNYRLPFNYSYEENGQRHHMRLWDYVTFATKNREHLSKTARLQLKSKTGPFSACFNDYLLEYVGTRPLKSENQAETLWFFDIIKQEVPSAKHLTDWMKSWGYVLTSLHPSSGGLLSFKGGLTFLAKPQQYVEGVLVPVEELFLSVHFGLLALDLFTTTGARIHEIMQISLDRECLIRLTTQAPLGAKDSSPRVRYVLRLVPKGEKKRQKHDFFISEETKRLIVKIGRALSEHYGLKPNEAIPHIPFCPHSPRAHRFNAAPYLFQAYGTHLSAQSLSCCMRFLLHGSNLRTQDGRQIPLQAHLLRHGFATHAANVEKIPIDIIGRWLHQKQVSVTEYYARPTDTMVAETADQYLAKIASVIDVNNTVLRSPEELQKLYDDAKGKAGTLADVVGGVCVSHGYCSVKFECIGCAGKVPDPAKRDQVERKKIWAIQEIEVSTKEGLFPEAQRMKQLVRDAELELQEMDMIEAYHQDENIHCPIKFTKSKK